jgi:hypothetical protein
MSFSLSFKLVELAGIRADSRGTVNPGYAKLVPMKPSRRSSIQPTGPALEILCRYLPAADRKRLWEAVNGPVPKGKRLGWACATPYCGKLHHMELSNDGSANWHNWKGYSRRLKEMKDGTSFEVPADDPPKFAARMRSALNYLNLRISIRSIPKAVRVTRIGRWGYLK